MKKLLSLLLLAALPALAQVTVGEPWVRATVAQQKATGAFMTLTSTQGASLVGASSPAAGVVEVHEMKMVDDVMRMRQIAVLELPAGKPVALSPGGYHLMLLELKQPLKDGDKVPLTLEIEDAQKVRSKIVVEAPVKPLNAAAMHH
ncbi:copper chaperone PCu(A)C [Duganella sp. CT11-25]|uniref:copper chaperone PCu(A)C n=1 Tax=unclassified Duganella TaxID=2636909 RepID=UPI0039B0B4A3